MNEFALALKQDIDRIQTVATVGVAIAHNATVAGAGVGASVGVGALVGSNPAGWALVGVAATGIGLSILAEVSYQNNILGFQDTVDSVGEAIQHGIEDPVIIGIFPINYMN